MSAAKVGRDVSEAIFAAPEQHPALRRRARDAASPSAAARPSTGSANIFATRSRNRTTAEADVADVLRSSRTDVLVLLPAGRLAAGDGILRRAGARGRLRLRQLHPGLHRLEPRLAQALRGARAADRRRRHQEPGRRHHRAPGARQPVPRARRAARPHLPAQFRRQHRFPEHARAGAAGIEEDLQDAGGHEPARHSARRPRTSMSARAITCRGSPTANGPISAWRAPPSAACRSTSS